jgi:hypothetical protein
MKRNLLLTAVEHSKIFGLSIQVILEMTPFIEESQALLWILPF